MVEVVVAFRAEWNEANREGDRTPCDWLLEYLELASEPRWTLKEKKANAIILLFDGSEEQAVAALTKGTVPLAKHFAGREIDQNSMLKIDPVEDPKLTSDEDPASDEAETDGNGAAETHSKEASLAALKRLNLHFSQKAPSADEAESEDADDECSDDECSADDEIDDECADDECSDDEDFDDEEQREQQALFEQRMSGLQEEVEKQAATIKAMQQKIGDPFKTVLASSEEKPHAPSPGGIRLVGKEALNPAKVARDQARRRLKFYLEEVDRLLGAEEYKAFVHELVRLYPHLREQKKLDCLFSQVYLLSMNEGGGYSRALEILTKTMACLGFFKKPNGDDVRESMRLQQLRISDLDESLDEARKYVLLREGMPVIFSFDIREVMNQIDMPAFRNFLMELADHSDNCLCFFRIPFVEERVAQRVAEGLGDLLSVRQIRFWPLTMEAIREYARRHLEDYGYVLSEDFWPCFEQMIIAEKNDGHFYGFNTVRKVVREVVVQKERALLGLAATAGAAEGALSAETDAAAKIAKSVELAISAETSEPEDEDERQPVPISAADLSWAKQIQIHDSGLSAEEELEQLIGLGAVKEKVLQLIQQFALMKKHEELAVGAFHMRFTGNPGTGKTTVARLIGRIMKERGLLRDGHFFEHTGRDLCGLYVGHTAPKTAAICREAYGSVLFIDEAYSLYRGDQNDRDYGHEALATLVVEMENHRQDFIVIMAGYTDEMELLMKGNSGLASRMPYEIHFPNYTREELCEIFFRFVKPRFAWEPAFETAARRFFDELSDEFLASKEFSNARFVRNVFDRVWGRAALRIQFDAAKPILIESDFMGAVNELKQSPNSLCGSSKRRIGFALADQE